MNDYTLPILPERPTFVESMDYWRALPERTARHLADSAVRDALVDWPEFEGFGSSDRNHAVHSYVLLAPGLVQREYGAMADLEHRANERGVDWDAMARLFAPAVTE